jgi:hypothetical protein
MKLFKILSLIILIGLISCETNDDQENIEITKTATITIDGLRKEVFNENVFGNSNCNSLYFTIYNQEEGFEQTEIEIDLRRDGTLKQISYYRQIRNETTQAFERTYYYPPFHDKLSAITITNFRFDENTKDIYLEYEGTLYKERDNSQSIAIEGTIDIKSFYDAPCGIEVLTSLDYNSENFNFNSIFESRGSSDTVFQDHFFRSNNGFEARLTLDENIGDLAIGTYPLTETNITKFFELSEYIGPPRAGQTSQSFNENEWIKYKTRGNFTITDKIEIDHFNTQIIGYFDIEVLNQNQVIYTIDRMEFVLNGS